MMSYKTDGAIVVVGGVVMAMNHRDDCGDQNEKNEKYCKTSAPAHICLSLYEITLIFADMIVKKLFVLGPEHLGTEPADGLSAGSTGDFLCCAVKGRDAPLRIHRKDAVGNAFQDGFREQ
jgi:hypothetical protein